MTRPHAAKHFRMMAEACALSAAAARMQARALRFCPSGQPESDLAPLRAQLRQSAASYARTSARYSRMAQEAEACAKERRK